MLRLQLNDTQEQELRLEARQTIGRVSERIHYVLLAAQRYRLKVSTATVRRALKRLRFSWHRPKLSPARRRDPEREMKEARLAEVLADSSAHLVAADECDVHLLPTLRSMWQRIGQQRRLPTPGQNKKRALLGGFDLRTESGSTGWPITSVRLISSPS